MPLPHPHPAPGRGGFGSIGEKSHTFPSAAPPPWGPGGGWRGAGRGGGWKGRSAPPKTPADLQALGRRCVPGGGGAPAQRGARRSLPPSVRVCVPGSGSIQPALFLPAAPQRVSEQGGGRGSLSAKCCSLVLRGGCSSSNSHSFRRLT